MAAVARRSEQSLIQSTNLLTYQNQLEQTNVNQNANQVVDGLAAVLEMAWFSHTNSSSCEQDVKQEGARIACHIVYNGLCEVRAPGSMENFIRYIFKRHRVVVIVVAWESHCIFLSLWNHIQRRRLTTKSTKLKFVRQTWWGFHPASAANAPSFNEIKNYFVEFGRVGTQAL